MNDVKLIKENINKVVNVAQDLYLECDDIKDQLKEFFVVFYLNSKNNIIAREIVSIGTLNSSIVHAREVFRGAIVRNANSIILVHNHPSGDVTPSDEDINITKKMVESGDLLGISVLDHVIVGKESYKSII